MIFIKNQFQNLVKMKILEKEMNANEFWYTEI